MPFRKKDPSKRGTRGSDLNMQLYGMAAKPLQADGSLPLCEEIDLAVEYHINSGFSEKKAIKETASEVRDIWKRTTQIQVSEDKSIIRKKEKVRAARKRTVMENSIDIVYFIILRKVLREVLFSMGLFQILEPLWQNLGVV